MAVLFNKAMIQTLLNSMGVFQLVPVASGSSPKVKCEKVKKAIMQFSLPLGIRSGLSE